ncbi:peroxisomal membrane protein PEX13 [Microplitis demolitor]|uniref:peroxisomal membrane protein PEX13 n=1 Tax=Microplitis demolitor TaxID=69319 RepID=UPI00043FFFA3|nr:peroxisomal membrane protein PEX13 [Microplitis demolitor]
MNQRPNTSTFNQFKSGPGSIPSGGAYTPGANGPPPVPPRAAVNYGVYRPYMSTPVLGYGGYGYGNSFPYSQYSHGYGSYPYGSTYPGLGPSGDVENRLIQFAEESTRPAFQSIQSIIHTFSSITMMLESTFMAMSSSFRAIVSVAENVGKVRSMFGQLLSTFALIRFAKWLYKYIAYKLGLSATDPSDESLWQKSVLEAASGDKKGPMTWPILLFFSLLAAIPYLVHKLVNSASISRSSADNPQAWFELNEPVYWATAIYDFNAASAEEMSLRAGQKVWLAPQSLQPKNLPGWSRATDKSRVGLIPSNYINVVAQVTKRSDSDNSAPASVSTSSSTSTLTNSLSANNIMEESFNDAAAAAAAIDSNNEEKTSADCSITNNIDKSSIESSKNPGSGETTSESCKDTSTDTFNQ